MIKIVACHCGSSEGLIRGFLKNIGFKDWIDIPIAKGKDNSMAVLNQLPPTPEKDMLRSFLKDASKWAVIIGYTENEMKWSDIAHNGPKSRIEAEFVVRSFTI